MKASELIEHLSSIIEKYWDLPVVWMWLDSDYWEYSITEFDFEKWNLVKEWDEYRYSYKDELTIPVFVTDI